LDSIRLHEASLSELFRFHVPCSLPCGCIALVLTSHQRLLLLLLLLAVRISLTTFTQAKEAFKLEKEKAALTKKKSTRRR